MNSYQALLTKALQEMGGYAATSDEVAWHRGACMLLQQAINASDDTQAEDVLDVLLHYLVDCGPAGDDYSPSLTAAMDAMQRKRKRK